jgi:CheY-like chemotaxis protein
VTADDKIMLIEDDAETRTFLGEILELEGFRVVTFANGREAMNYLGQSRPPRLVIMDMQMPQMDGSQFRAAMLQDPRLAQVPVVVVTAYEPSVANNLSVSKVFRKPLDIEALVNTVRQYC